MEKKFWETWLQIVHTWFLVISHVSWSRFQLITNIIGHNYYNWLSKQFATIFTSQFTIWHIENLPSTSACNISIYFSFLFWSRQILYSIMFLSTDSWWLKSSKLLHGEPPAVLCRIWDRPKDNLRQTVETIIFNVWRIKSGWISHSLE